MVITREDLITLGKQVAAAKGVKPEAEPYVPMLAHKCSMCKQEKSIADFTVGSAYCKSCQTIANRAHNFKRYGLTFKQANDLFEAQDGKCAICSKYLDNPQVDHYHTTNEVRGLLCVNCNMGLGYFKDNIEFFEAAVKYLRAARDKSGLKGVHPNGRIL